MHANILVIFTLVASVTTHLMHADIIAVSNDPFIQRMPFQMAADNVLADKPYQVVSYITPERINHQRAVLAHDLITKKVKVALSGAAVVTATALSVYFFWQDFKQPESFETRMQMLEDRIGKLSPKNSSMMRRVFSTMKNFVYHAVPTVICQAALTRASNAISSAMRPINIESIKDDKIRFSLMTREIVQSAAALDESILFLVAQNPAYYTKIPVFVGDYAATAFNELTLYLCGHVARMLTSNNGELSAERNEQLKAVMLEASTNLGNDLAYLIAFIQSKPANPIFGQTIESTIAELINNHALLHCVIQQEAVHAAEVHACLQAIAHSLNKLVLFSSY